MGHVVAFPETRKLWNHMKSHLFLPNPFVSIHDIYILYSCSLSDSKNKLCLHLWFLQILWFPMSPKRSSNNNNNNNNNNNHNGARPEVVASLGEVCQVWRCWSSRFEKDELIDDIMKKRHEIHTKAVKNFNNCLKQSKISRCAFEMSCRLLGVRFPRQLGTIGFWNYFGYLSSCFFVNIHSNNNSWLYWFCQVLSKQQNVLQTLKITVFQTPQASHWPFNSRRLY